MNGAQLRRVRLAARVSQAELAWELGQRQMWISRLERKPDVHAAIASLYLSGIEAKLEDREKRREDLARGLATLATRAGAR